MIKEYFTLVQNRQECGEVWSGKKLHAARFAGSWTASIKEISTLSNVKVGRMIEAWFNGDGPFHEPVDNVQPPQVVTERESQYHNRRLKSVCSFGKLHCPFCSLDYRTSELVAKVREGGEELADWKVDPQLAVEYGADVQYLIEDTTISHAIHATHCDELVEIVPGLESPSQKDAWDCVSQAAVVEVRALKGRYVQATKWVVSTGRTGTTDTGQPRGGDSASSVQQPLPGDQTGGGAEEPTTRGDSSRAPETDVPEGEAATSGGDKKRRKRARCKASAGVVKNKQFAEKVIHNAEAFTDDLRRLSPIFSAARRTGGEMAAGSTNSNIRRGATIHEFNLAAAAGSHRTEPNLWIPLEAFQVERGILWLTT